MESKLYLESLKKKYQRYFDIEENVSVGNIPIDLFAKSHVRNEKFFASKSVTLYAFENNEYCYAKAFQKLTFEDVVSFVNVLKKQITDQGNVKEDHMSSTFTGILITHSIIDPTLVSYIKKFNYQKSYLLGLKGWSDVRLVLVNLETDEVVTSKKAKDVKKLYLPN